MRARKRDWLLYKETIFKEQNELRSDWLQRLENALVSLANMDPGWIWWVERNVPLNLTIRQTTRIIERRARVLACNGYGFSHSQWMGIVYSDRYFSEQGLVAG